VNDLGFVERKPPASEDLCVREMVVGAEAHLWWDVARTGGVATVNRQNVVPVTPISFQLHGGTEELLPNAR
jgi:hypothetical protein